MPVWIVRREWTALILQSVRTGSHSQARYCAVLTLPHHTPVQVLLSAHVEELSWRTSCRAACKLCVYRNRCAGSAAGRALNPQGRGAGGPGPNPLLCPQDGQSLIRMGEHGTKLFLIRQGQVCVMRPSAQKGGPPLTLAVLGRGHFVGERTLVTGDDHPRRVTRISFPWSLLWSRATGKDRYSRAGP